jgi:tripartite-type tricarboxylate transporter receptor subunit TctC
MELHFTQKTAARPVMLPPGAPREALAILRKAFAALELDQEFQEEAKKARVEFNYVPGEVIDNVVRMIVSTKPEIAQRYAAAFAVK